MKLVERWPGPHYRATGARGQVHNAFMNITPSAPFQGPPIPAGLGFTWSGEVRGKMPGVLVRTSIRGYDQVRNAIGSVILGEKPMFKNPWKWFS